MGKRVYHDLLKNPNDLPKDKDNLCVVSFFAKNAKNKKSHIYALDSYDIKKKAWTGGVDYAAYAKQNKTSAKWIKVDRDGAK